MSEKKQTVTGMGRQSMALGRNDARASHRNAQAAQNTEQLYGKGLEVEQGKVRVKLSRKIQGLGSDATLEDVVSTLNLLLKELQ